MRRPTVLSLPLQLVFPGGAYPLKVPKNIRLGWKQNNCKKDLGLKKFYETGPG